MPAKGKSGINRLRVAVVAPLMVAACAALTAGVRLLPDSLPGNTVAVAAGVVLSVVAASLLEWLVHRYVYHRRVVPLLGRIFRIHHHGHHFAIFPTWRYVTHGTPRRHPILDHSIERLHPRGWRNVLTKLAHFAFYMVAGIVCVGLPAWLATGNRVVLATIVVCNVVFADLFVRVHDAIHYPERHRWMQRLGWFRFPDRHHYIHHVDTEANVNFLLPLADWLLGTMRRTLTADELAQHGSLDEAKAQPVGESEPAREVARPRAGAKV
jgi:hypothetical protein